MPNRFDDFSKSLAESVPRRESLRRLGGVFAGAALMPFTLALGASKPRAADPCKTFCMCRNKSQQNACLAACKACGGKTSRLCGSCGSYVCCPSGLACCGSACVDLFEDFYNCGGCGIGCDEPSVYEEGACVDGTCMYQCISGALRCNGACTPVLWDPNNCGACSNVCGGTTPHCNQGMCSECWAGWANCGYGCISLDYDNANCGACGVVCPSDQTCVGGFCQYQEPWWGDSPW
jgi:hypothetical protein